MSQSNIRFIGVSTSNSSIMKIFPEWSKTLGLNATISGIDIPLNSEPEIYTSEEVLVALQRIPYQPV